jgi:nucleoid DNA-binding protein
MLVNALSKELGVPKKKVRAILAGLAEATGIALKQGKSVQITGIGTLRVRSVPVAPGSKEMSDVKRIALTAARQLKATALEP